MMKPMIGAATGLLLFSIVSSVRAGQWEPARFAKESTLEFLTVQPEGGEHWSPVWLVVLDGDVYVRLGSHAAWRMRENRTAPYVKVRIGGEEVERVRVEPMPQMKERVDAAMAEKYWTDSFIRYFDHPLTARLRPE